MDSPSLKKKLGSEGRDMEDDIWKKPYSDHKADSPPTYVQVAPSAVAVSFKETTPSSYLCLAMFACCCFWPMGICALKFSQKSAYAAGAMDFETAKNRGESAMKISIGAIVLGLILLSLRIVYIVHNARVPSEK